MALRGTGSGYGREIIRGDRRWRDQQRWHGIQDQADRESDDPLLFCSEKLCADGQGPGALTQDTNGTFYGPTASGGSSGACEPNTCGTVFSLAVGLGPFVEPQPTSGKVGSTVKILGTNLLFATSVTFNGTAATFKVASGSLITATVPPGATTGPIQVTLPSGTLTSNVNFQVLP